MYSKVISGLIKPEKKEEAVNIYQDMETDCLGI